MCSWEAWWYNDHGLDQQEVELVEKVYFYHQPDDVGDVEGLCTFSTITEESKMPKQKQKQKTADIGFHYGRTDLERIGLFAEMSYLHGMGYTRPYVNVFNEESIKGRQMIPGFPQSKCARDDGYFIPFRRIFQKEAYFNKSRAAYLERLAATAKNIAPRTFVQPSPTKRQTGSGDYYGCFEKITAFSPLKRAQPPRVKEPKNMLSKPPKKGGPGYPDITFSPYPEYIESLYRGELQDYRNKYIQHMLVNKRPAFLSAIHRTQYFDPNPYFVPEEDVGPTYAEPVGKIVKGFGSGVFIPSSPGKKVTFAVFSSPEVWMEYDVWRNWLTYNWLNLMNIGIILMDGGCKAGTFGKYPAHSEDKYFPPIESVPRTMSSNVFYPQMNIRSMQTRSIVNYNVDFGVNAENWRKCGLIVYTQ
ncbi:UPF0602 protein C4orf47 homolog [Schistocerca piceifrons]|uniref:UPF0602 protein C4orf47 homolog n=1 Tax=Schistocerca piceifrons TaxID=274613 RepID=UPI001F5F129C|nr:UPF0602 protein C4orf47 homolog [Schistocerca piceifrons]